VDLPEEVPFALAGDFGDVFGDAGFGACELLLDRAIGVDTTDDGDDDTIIDDGGNGEKGDDGTVLPRGAHKNATESIDVSKQRASDGDNCIVNDNAADGMGALSICWITPWYL
jgi:hypothetical protein